MTKKPTYEELEQRIEDFERETAAQDRMGGQIPLFASAVSQSSEGLAVVDLDGNLLSLNDAFAEMHGYSAEELIGKNLSIFHTSQQMPSVEAANRQIKETGDFKGEIWHVRRDGTAFPTMMHNSLIRDAEGNPIGMTGTLRDITDIKKTEEALRKERDRAQAYLDIAGVIVVVINADQSVAVINKKGRDVLGYGESEVVGEEWFEKFIPERDREKTRSAFSELMAGNVEPVEYFENHVMTKDNKERLIAWYNAVLRDDEGRIIATLSSGEDITKRKEVENALRENENRLNIIFESAPDAYYINDYEGVFIDGNRAAEDLLGYPREALVGKNFLDVGILSMDEAEAALKALARSINGESTGPDEYTLKRKDGAKVSVEIHTHPVKIAGEGRVLGIARDITERKRAEEVLQESEEKLTQAIQGNSIPTFLIDSNHIITHWNNACESLTGFTEAEMVGARKQWLAFYSTERPVLADLVMDGAAEEEIEVYYEGKHRKSLLVEGAYEGDDFFPNLGEKGSWLFFAAAPLRDQGGNIIGAIQTFQDITERMKTEEQLRQSQKMEAVGTLAGGVAHDFNNILTTIIGNAGLALTEIGRDGALREEIEEIEAAGERAASLTRQLLAFSRKQISRPEVMNFNELLTDVEKMLGRLIGEDVEFLTILEPALWQVMADPGQMEQVIMNLVVNARDAMPMGGKLIVETANADLGRDYFREHGLKVDTGPYVVLTVSDTGIGMDKNTQENIYDPFFTTKKTGTGLGLSTVYGIVKQSKGYIWVYSEPGQGAVFKIYLPRSQDDAEPKEEGISVDDVRGSETVLIVEDDGPLRALAQKTLQRKGYRVLTAENGEDALRISKGHENPIDLMLTDVVMPKMGGKETAEQLQPLYPQMKVIYMSGYTDDAIVRHGVLAPGLNFIEKPFSPEALARKVREVLDDGSEK